MASRTIALAFLAPLAALAVSCQPAPQGGTAGAAPAVSPEAGAPQPFPAPAGPASPAPAGSFRQVARAVLPVVVEINVTELIKQQVPQFDFPFDLPFPFGPQAGPQGGGGEQTLRQSALGSGIIVRRAGSRYYVLTNHHVVKDATDISVRLESGKVYKARVVGSDPRKDIALVSFDSRDSLPLAVLGDSDQLQVGDIVLAVGNPLGFQSTLTMGVVSALGRHSPQQDQVASYTDYIQTDAAINPGNSGGALVDTSGQVVGINTWIAAPSGGNIGLGFAIPINNARKEIDQFISHGKVEYGWLGVQVADVQPEDTFPGLARDLRVTGMSGAFVLNVYRGSPADRGGILPGDYITRVGDTAIVGSDQLTRVVGGLQAGHRYLFALVRYGKSETLTVDVAARDPEDKVVQDRNLWPGMTVVDLTSDIRQQEDIPGSQAGVVVGALASDRTPTAIAGLQPGDVITAMDGHPVRNLMEYYQVLNVHRRGDLTFRIIREGTELSIGVPR